MAIFNCYVSLPEGRLGCAKSSYHPQTASGTDQDEVPKGPTNGLAIEIY